MDGQLVFSPDMGFTGVTAFNYTVADVFGQTATLVATLSVLPSQPEAEITFADGSQFASVAEGIDAVIIGALNISGIEDGDEPLVMEVFEGDSRLPSQRFVIAGDKLQLSSGVDHEADGAIPLRIVASRNGLQAAAAEFEIEVRSTAADSPRTGVPDMPDFAQGPTLAYSTELSLLEQAGNDQFVFEAAEIESIEADWNNSEALDLAAQLPAPGNLDAVPQDAEGKPETVSDSHATPETQPPSGGDDFSNI